MQAELIATLAVAGTTVVGGSIASLTGVVDLQDRFRRRNSGELALAVAGAARVEAAAVAAPTHVAPIPLELSRTERVLRDGVLRCGCVKHPPLADFSLGAEEWEFEGLYVEMAYAVQTLEQIEVALTPIDWSELNRAFDEKELDLVLSVFETRQRASFGDFVCPFYRIGVSGVTQSLSDKVVEPIDLQRSDVTVVVTRGEAGWESAVVDLRIPRHRLLVIESSDLGDMMDYVVTGRADVAICDDVTCNGCVTTRPGLRRVFADQPLNLCSNSIMVPKGDPVFASWIDDRFSKARHHPDVLHREATVLEMSDRLIRRFR